MGAELTMITRQYYEALVAERDSLLAEKERLTAERDEMLREKRPREVRDTSANDEITRISDALYHYLTRVEKAFETIESERDALQQQLTEALAVIASAGAAAAKREQTLEEAEAERDAAIQQSISISNGTLTKLAEAERLGEAFVDWAEQPQMDEDDDPTGLFECQLCGDEAETKEAIEHHDECPVQAWRDYMKKANPAASSQPKSPSPAQAPVGEVDEGLAPSHSQ